MKKELRIIYILVVCFFLLLIGCKNGILEEAVEPIINLMNNPGCKTLVSKASNKIPVPITQEDCIEYIYDENGVLHLFHTNAGFNCCPGQILVDISVNGNEITIIEQESEQGCRCLCLMDLTYQIKNLKPGEYTIIIDELYVNANDEKLKLTLNLITSPSGSLCIKRNYYPWQ